MKSILTILLLSIGASLLHSDPIMWVSSNRLDNILIRVNGADEGLWIDAEAFEDSQPTANPQTTAVGYGLKAPSGWRFLTKSQHRDPFSQPPDSILLWTNHAIIETNAFEFRSYSIDSIPGSAALLVGSYNYQIWYESFPPVPVRTNYNQNVIHGPGLTSFFLGVTRKLESGERYLGWLQLVRDVGDAYSPFRFGPAALDFLPDRPIRAGERPEFPKLQSEVTQSEVRLSVPAAYRHYLGTWLILERTESLEEPVNWEFVDFGGGSTVTLPADTASGFYRLRLGQ